MDDEFQLNLDQRLPESREAREQAMRLIAVRLEAAETERFGNYAAEFDALIDSIWATESENERLLVLLRLIDALTGYVWLAMGLLDIEEMSDEIPGYLDWLRQQNEDGLLAYLAHTFEGLASGPNDES